MPLAGEHGAVGPLGRQADCGPAHGLADGRLDAAVLPADQEGSELLSDKPGSPLPPAIILQPNDGCLTLARALLRRGVEVHALTNREYAYVLATRGIRGRVMPDPAHDSAEWLTTLKDLAKGGGGVVLSGSDVATEWLTNHRRELPESLRSFESTDRTHLAVMDKSSLYRAATTAGVSVPTMHHVRDRAELNAILPALTYPSVVKASLGHLAKSLAGFGTVFVSSRKEMTERAAALLDHDLDFLVTEVVAGPERLLEGAVLVRLEDGTYPLEYSRRKVRQWPLDNGVGCLAVAERLPETVDVARRLLDHVGYHGIAAVETKRDERTGKLYLIEINVRVPALFGLAEACGVDGSWRLYATLAGLPLGAQPPPIEGRKVMIPQREVRAAVRRIRQGETSWIDVVRSWRGTRDFGLLSVRDPMPSLAFIRQLIRRGFGRTRGMPSGLDVAAHSRTGSGPAAP
jgi:D-aspartate ligase